MRRELAARYGEDAAQEALCRLLAADPSPDDPWHWVRCVARRVAVDEHRRQSRIVPLENAPEEAQPADQLARLEAVDELSRVPARLREEVQHPERLTPAARQQRRRLRRKRDD